VIRRWWCFSERLACLPRLAWRRQGGGASFFQDLDLEKALSAEAELGRPREGQGSPGGRIIWKIERRRLEAKRNVTTP